MVSEEEVDSDVCSANRDLLIKEPSEKPYVYSPRDVSRSFVEALFCPHRRYGGHESMQTYGQIDDGYLYYPIKVAQKGDTSLSEEELSYITGGCMIEQTRDAIEEVLCVPKNLPLGHGRRAGRRENGNCPPFLLSRRLRAKDASGLIDYMIKKLAIDDYISVEEVERLFKGTSIDDPFREENK